MDAVPFVVGSRAGGRVHSRGPKSPGFTLCGWHWAGSYAAVLCASPLGGDPAFTAPRCLRCVRRDGTESSDATP
eukprot:646893-Lingulodinium_polyedra.AAC.1